MGRSNETRLLEVIIGLYDLAQLVFGAPVAAIGIRMVPLHQLLEPPLDLRRQRRFCQIQGLERLALERFERPARCLGRPAMRYSIAVIQYVMRILRAVTGAAQRARELAEELARS